MTFCQASLSSLTDTFIFYSVLPVRCIFCFGVFLLLKLFQNILKCNSLRRVERFSVKGGVRHRDGTPFLALSLRDSLSLDAFVYAVDNVAS